jgi:hypothetical protein
MCLRKPIDARIGHVGSTVFTCTEGRPYFDRSDYVSARLRALVLAWQVLSHVPMSYFLILLFM